MLYTSVGDAEGVLNTGKLAEAGVTSFGLLTSFQLQESNIGNIAVLCYLLLGETKRALQAQDKTKLMALRILTSLVVWHTPFRC